MIFMPFESQYATSSNLGPTSHRLVTVVHNGLQGNLRSMIFI